MRKYIRHPSDIPIELDVSDGVVDKESLNNISMGGLSFQSKTDLPLGSQVRIRIPFVGAGFEARGVVVWCRRHGRGYDIGVKLTDKEQAYTARMVEQVCHIEHYKREVLRKEGRKITGEEAALEWIGKYAHLFPDITN